MRWRYLLAVVCCAILSARAQSTNSAATRFLGLRDCIDLALSRNLDLQIQHVTAQVARYDLGASYGIYSPVFSFSGRHNFLDQPADVDPKKTTLDRAYQLDENFAGPELSGRIPFGLSYDFSAMAGEKQARTDFNDEPPLAALFPPYGIRETNNAFAEAGVNLRQHLLRDFWIDADWQRVLLRRKDLKISEETLRFKIMQTVLAVQLAYADLVLAREEVRVQEKALELKNGFLEETRRRVQVGDLPPLDAQGAEAQQQRTLTALGAAREAFLVQQSVLKDLITDDYRAWVGIEIQPGDPLLVIPETINLAQSFENGARNRPDLVQARLAVEKSAVTVRYTANQLFPAVDLIGRFGGLGIRPDLDSAISDTMHFRNPQYFYGAVISFPLDNIAERNNYRASRANRRIAELELKRAEQGVLVAIEEWANRVRSRLTQIDSARKARAYAESALAAEEKKLANGMSTSFVVLQLQEDLTAARNLEVQAIADYNKAVAQFAFAEATTLQRAHVSVEIR